MSKSWYVGPVAIVGPDGRERTAEVELLARDGLARTAWGGHLNGVGDPSSFGGERVIFRMSSGHTGELVVSAVGPDGAVEVTGVGDCPFS